MSVEETKEETVKTKRARIQQELFNLPPVTVEQRERLIQWLDGLKVRVTDLFYALTPMKVWEDTPGNIISIELLGSHDLEGLPPGLYCIDIPEGMDDKYRDPVALYFVHHGADVHKFNKLGLLPLLMSVALPMPTMHERAAARGNLIKFAADNKDNADITEWTSKLV